MMAWWANRNSRERRLFVATAAVLVFAAAALTVRGAWQRIGELDTEIAQKELELENLTAQYVQREIIEARYEKIVKEHSSELTVEEIHDNLRREIYDLTRVTMPPKDGQPSRTLTLVRIPTLREGKLIDQGEAFREYQIRFSIQPTFPDFLFAFIQKIEESEQLLRIDELESGRKYNGVPMGGTFVVTRTVLDDPNNVPERRQSGVFVRPSRYLRASADDRPRGKHRGGF